MRLIFLCLFMFSSFAFSQTVFCFKKGVETNEVNPTIKLDGAECRGVYSIEDMEFKGWKLGQKQILKQNEKFTHFYFFKKDTPLPSFENKKLDKISKINLNVKKFIIENVKNNTAIVPMGDLKVGQSGVIFHKAYDEDIIIAKAIVTKSEKDYSTITFKYEQMIEQDAIPQIDLAPSNGDIFILNHLYTNSLLIVPNTEAKLKLTELYTKQMFINEELFAIYLKINSQPKPTKETILEFCKINQIGTVFLVIYDTVYIIDAQSFTILDSHSVTLTETTQMLPFFTKVTEIEGSAFDLGVNYNFWDENYKLFKDEVKDYHEYYLKLLGLEE